MQIRTIQTTTPVSTAGRNNAFTLVEVLVAAAVGAIIFASLYRGISNSYGLLQTSRLNLRATQIMVSELEGLRLCAWGVTNVNTGTNVSQLFNANIVPTTFTNYFYPLGLNGTSNLGTVYYGSLGITPMSNPASVSSSKLGGSVPAYVTNMAEVTVTVTWTDGLNGHTTTHTRHMSSYVAKYGIQNYVIQH